MDEGRMSSDTENEKAKFHLDVWEKHEQIAMHFNDLIIKVRIQALGAIAALITIGGVLLKTVPPEPHLPWGLIATVLAVLFAFWIAIWLLDFIYYNRLLAGAVDSILALEDAINADAKITFTMSHKIESAVLGNHSNKDPLIGPLLFYSIVSVVLLAGVAYSWWRFACAPS